MRAFRRRSRRIPDPRWPDDEDDEAAAVGGFEMTVDFGGSTMTLVQPMIMRSTSFTVSAPADLTPGGLYLIGAPWLPGCEVVEVLDENPRSGRPCQIGRARFKTLAAAHPVGTPVTPVTVSEVSDWGR